jgi:hypothetical protein
MLHLLDESLETFLRATVPLPARQVDVAFEAPDAEWGVGVTKPTVNLYLWDVRRNQSERESGMELIHDDEGAMRRREPPPRVDCRYLVTAWTTEVADEHRLLGAVLAGLLQHPVVAEEHLPALYRLVRPLPRLEVADPNGEETADIWSALGGQLKPGLDLRVTATMDFVLAHDVGPAVKRYEVGLMDTTPSHGRSRVLSIGGRVAEASRAEVTSPRGVAVTDEEGRFLVRANEGDEVVVEGEKPAKGKVLRTGDVNFSRPGARGQPHS